MAPKTVSVSVKYSKPGTQPPIFLAGSFSEPAWQPQEMQYTTDDRNEHEFSKEVKVEPGKEYQYKFRIGLGDWWILNEDSATATDDAGNRNNVLTAPVPVTDDTMGSKPTEEVREASIEMDESSESRQPWGAREKTPEYVEEAMGTRETSDVLFSDEIIKEIEQSIDVSLPMTPDVDETNKASLPTIPNIEEPKVSSMPITPEPIEPLEPHPTPAFEMEKSKADLVGDFKDTKEDHTEIADPTEEVAPAAAPAPEVATGDSLTTPSFEESSDAEHSEENREDFAEPPHVRTVVVEKLDGEPSYGDDFGPDATVAQKDAHVLRAKDAEPDQTIIRDNHTPDLADVAAEVADVAESLDRDSPTPPISDEEAGRIGYRRMSNTPIPEVAETAAEVADVAATLDKQDLANVAPPLDKKALGDLLEARGYFAILNDESIVFPETPPDEKIPLFPHERGGPPSNAKSRPNYPVDIPRRLARLPGPPSYLKNLSADYDPNDPNITPFPDDREGILRELALIEQRIPPATNEEIHSPGNPSAPGTQIPDQASSLDPITEENDDEEELHLNGVSVNGDGLPSWSNVEGVEEDKVDEDKVEEPQVQVNGARKPVEEPVPAEKDDTPTPAVVGEGESAEPEFGVDGGSNQPAPAAAVHLSEPRLTHSMERSLDGGKDDPVDAASESSSVRGQGVEPKLTNPINHFLDGSEQLPLSVSPTRLPATPLIVGNRQLGHEEGEVQNITTPAGFSIQVQPATPRGSTADPDVGKTTAFEDKNGNNQIKSRKRQPSPTPDRPLTPSSMRGKEQSRNFLKAFWRVVFVEWIGGLIMRLCNGGRGRQTLLAVGAVAILASAPAMYKSLVARLADFKARIP